jgi:hypothetical protein
VWLDTRNDPGGYDSQLMYSFSEDQGQTWSPNEFLGPAFDPHVGWPQQNKMGDYFDMVSDDLGADLAYAATYNGEQDVYYIRIGTSVMCPADVNGDDVVDVLDLLLVLAAWGATSGPEDINGDGIVDVLDLLELLANWGPCPAPPLGACCYYPSGDCADLTQADCIASDGFWQGSFTDCASFQCPIPPEGDLIENALVIQSLPIEINGSTAAFHNDYDEACPNGGSISPDVVYAYTPTSNVTVSISLCSGQTDYDTKVYVYEDVAGNLVACSDDYCSSPYPDASKLSNVVMNAGSTYYIIVDGGNNEWGQYTLAIYN